MSQTNIEICDKKESKNLRNQNNNTKKYNIIRNYLGKITFEQCLCNIIRLHNDNQISSIEKLK